MTATLDTTEAEDSPQTGHRPGRRPEEPRNSTVCFMVSESERAAIDALGFCTNSRRSAILTRIVVSFMEGVTGDVKFESAKRDLVEFLKECREAVEAKPDLFKQFAAPEPGMKPKK